MQIVHSQLQHEVQACKAQIKIHIIDTRSEKSKLLEQIRQMDEKILRLQNQFH
jgi:hypothetical protein